MIRVYIIAADTAEPLSFAYNRAPGGRGRSIPALREIVTIPELADPARMRAVATEFHQHFKEKGRG